MKHFRTIFLLILLSIFSNCKFLKIDQPASAEPGETIDISLTVYDDVVPEPNPHKWVLCVLVPNDWSFMSGEYSGSTGSGIVELNPAWADSAEIYYPASDMGENMKWIGMTSDTGYTYDAPITVDGFLKLQVGETEGKFNLAYLVTKATQGLLGTGWTAISYPHCFGIPDSCQPAQTYKVETAPEWDALFDRKSGWTGSDATYSIPLSGKDVYSDNQEEKTLFVFGDTFIGDVNNNDQRFNTSMIRNTAGVLQAREPIEAAMSFLWYTDTQNKPAALFEADTPDSKPGDWIWPMDGIAIGDKIYVFGLRLMDGEYIFKLIGATLISFSLDSSNNISASLYLASSDNPSLGATISEYLLCKLGLLVSMNLSQY